MSSGLFGSSYNRGQLQKRKKLHRRLLDRELAQGDYVLQCINKGMMAQVWQIAMKTPSRQT